LLYLSCLIKENEAMKRQEERRRKALSMSSADVRPGNKDTKLSSSPRPATGSLGRVTGRRVRSATADPHFTGNSSSSPEADLLKTLMGDGDGSSSTWTTRAESPSSSGDDEGQLLDLLVGDIKRGRFEGREKRTRSTRVNRYLPHQRVEDQREM
jgi:hypothetical protein